MPLLDIEKTIKGLTADKAQQDLLRQGATLGLKAAIEEVERLLNSGCPKVPAYSAALQEALIYLKAMQHRAEKGQSTHPSTPVGD